MSIEDLLPVSAVSVAAGVLCIGLFLDVFTTIQIISQPQYREANPVIRFFVTHFGLSGIVIAKLSVIVGVISFIRYAYPEDYVEPSMIATAVVFGVIWSIAGVWNSIILY